MYESEVEGEKGVPGLKREGWSASSGGASETGEVADALMEEEEDEVRTNPGFMLGERERGMAIR